MVKKSAKALLKFAAVFFATVFMLLVCFVMAVSYWAYTGPRDLSKYLPDIENSLNELTGNTIKIGKAQLSWSKDELLFVEAKNVTIIDETGFQVATLPEVEI